MVCFVEKVLAKAKKMVVTMSRNRIYMQPMRWLSMYTLEGSSFSLGGWWLKGRILQFLHSQWCSSCSHDMFPRVFTISPHFILYPLPKVLLFYLYRWAKGEALHPHICYVGESPNFQLFVDDGPKENTKLGKQPI